MFLQGNHKSPHLISVCSSWYQNAKKGTGNADGRIWKIVIV